MGIAHSLGFENDVSSPAERSGKLTVSVRARYPPWKLIRRHSHSEKEPRCEMIFGADRRLRNASVLVFADLSITM